jgi:hypothetical protein
MNAEHPRRDRRSERPHPRVRWTTVAMAILCAAMAFGGTFTCHGENNSSDFTRNPTTGVG